MLKRENMFFIKFFGLILLVFRLVTSDHDVTVRGTRFEYCDHLVPLGPEKSVHITSPNFPKRYTPNSSCRYTITAPLDFEINAQCNIELDMIDTNCTTDNFYVSVEGDRTLEHGEFFCGKGYIQRKSYFRALVIAYTSTSNIGGGSFSCLVETKPQSCECGWTVPTTGKRIYKGEDALLNEYPFAVGFVNILSGRLFCAGTIIAHHYVLTAASCFNSYTISRNIFVRVGENNLNMENETTSTVTHSISAIIQHPMYEPNTKANDIALALTKTNIEWSFDVGPVCLPFHYSFNPFADEMVDAVGWGTSQFMGPPSKALKKVTVNVTENQYCRKIYTDLDDTQMCTLSLPKDTCLFDAGGPLVLREKRLYVVGVTGMTSSCGLYIPSVHTRVSSYLNWITSIIGEKRLCLK